MSNELMTEIRKVVGLCGSCMHHCISEDNTQEMCGLVYDRKEVFEDVMMVSWPGVNIEEYGCVECVDYTSVDDPVNQIVMDEMARPESRESRNLEIDFRVTLEALQ